MKVSIQLKESTQPIEHEYVNTYQKGDFYVVYTTDGKGTACSSNPCVIAESGHEFHDKLMGRFGGKMAFNG